MLIPDLTVTGRTDLRFMNCLVRIYTIENCMYKAYIYTDMDTQPRLVGTTDTYTTSNEAGGKGMEIAKDYVFIYNNICL